MRPATVIVACLLVTGWFSPHAPTVRAEEPLNFNRDIRPLLSEHCFACHGFDAKKRQADLRLDVAEGSNSVIAAGKPDESELWHRITSADPEKVMPPPSTKRPLSDAQKALLRKWIEQGAPYQKHWAFEPPVKSPEPKAPAATTNPIDAFLSARLEKEGLASRPEASKATLIRRVAFSLTGLPPTIAEVATYQADTADGAYERMVDRYLESTRYGQEMARHWLDVARYADTHGLHLDNERSMWAYRDWVVDSFNKNQPFDQFTVDQLAGDLVPNPSLEQIVATGFNRCNVTSSEGGSIEAELLYRYAVDRTATAVQAWMGLTAGCAVCHDHKYDPLSTKEFYSLYAFFYSSSDPAMDGNNNTTAPISKLITPELQTKLDAARAAELEAKRKLDELVAKTTSAEPAADIVKTIEDVWLDDIFPQGSRVSCNSRNSSVWSTASEIAPQRGLRALKQRSASNYNDKFENSLTPLYIPAKARLTIGLRLDKYEPSQAVRIELNTTRANRAWVWGDASKFGMDPKDPNYRGALPSSDAWTDLELPIDTLGLQQGDQVLAITLAQVGGNCWWDNLRVTGESTLVGDVRASFAAWFKSRQGKDTPEVPGDLAGALKAGPDGNPSEEVRDKLVRFFLSNVARAEGELGDAQKQWLLAKEATATVEGSIPWTFVFSELGTKRDAFVMQRGQYDKPGESVNRNTPAVFPPLNAADPNLPTRLDLAKWMVAPEHPTTARVQVNRLWQQFFGTGIVKTSDDFGSQGEPPSHPELLDWLAVTYRESGWNTKSMVKLMLTSAAFKRDAVVDPAVLARDPYNRLLARGPRIRLDAEQLRDNALFVGGLLDETRGGAGVKSYQPPNIWEPVGYSDSNTRFYLQDHGASLYRRSLYAYLKRTAPPPFMSNFDAPNREQLCARRERSNTPLQALQLMNDTQHFEAARGFAARILAEAGATPSERVDFAYRTVLSRSPSDDEKKIVLRVLQTFLDRYIADPSAAAATIVVGESPVQSKAPPSELAAYTMLANMLLNLDETISRD
jgi:hypothetical protein